MDIFADGEFQKAHESNVITDPAKPYTGNAVEQSTFGGYLKVVERRADIYILLRPSFYLREMFLLG